MWTIPIVHIKTLWNICADIFILLAQEVWFWNQLLITISTSMLTVILQACGQMLPASFANQWFHVPAMSSLFVAAQYIGSASYNLRLLSAQLRLSVLLCLCAYAIYFLCEPFSLNWPDTLISVFLLIRLSHSTLQLTHTCISPQFLKTILVAWNLQTNQINSACEQNTFLASNGIIFETLSRMAVWWFRRLTQPFSSLIHSQNLCLAHGLSNWDGFSWVGDQLSDFRALHSLSSQNAFFFRIAVFFCICHSLLLRGRSARGSPNPSQITMVKEQNFAL